MPTSSPGPSPAPSWGVGLAAISAVLLAGGAVIWAHRDASPTVPGGADGELPRVARWLPTPGGPEVPGVIAPAAAIDQPEMPALSPGLHSVAYEVEHGTRVVKIRVVPDGDEIVIDAATGRLIETRPSRPTGAPPMGRFAVPFVPAT